MFAGFHAHSSLLTRIWQNISSYKHKTGLWFTDPYPSVSVLDNGKSLESLGKQLQTISETESTSAQDSVSCTGDSTSHFAISRSPKAKEISSPETVQTSESDHENAQGESNESFEVSSVSVTKQEPVVVEESTAKELKPSEEQRKDDSIFHSDYRFRLRLRVHYRINEEAIRCLLLLRWVGWAGCVTQSVDQKKYFYEKNPSPAPIL